MEELAEGFTSALDQCNAQERLARNTIQCQSEVRAGPHRGPQAPWGGTRTQTQVWGLKAFEGPLPSQISLPPTLLTRFLAGKNYENSFNISVGSREKTKSSLCLLSAPFDCLPTCPRHPVDQPVSSHWIGRFVQKSRRRD